MSDTLVKGIICVQDELGVVYEVCKISELSRRDGTADYTFLPNYTICDLLDPEAFPGISGLNLELRRQRFMRVGALPQFIEERTPSPSDIDFKVALAYANMQANEFSRLTWLIKSGFKHPNDNLFVIADPEREDQVFPVENIVTLSKNTEIACRKVLDLVACGARITIGGDEVQGGQIKTLHDTVRLLYLKGRSYRLAKQRDGIAKAAKSGNIGKGREIKLEEDKLADVVKRFENGDLGANEAAAELGVSRATFYRKLKAYQES